MRVLFICRANAGRSQMAEALYNALTSSRDAVSAGVQTSHSTMKDDMHIPPIVAETLNGAGLDASAARRKPVTEEMVAAAEKVIVIMQEGEYPLPPYLQNSGKLERWGDVPDAKGTDLAFHMKTLANIREKVTDLIAGTRS